jgi:broad specificity phosphatase PhoE
LSKLKNIYLIRHGETDWNRDSRFQGQTDVPLNQTGKDQASALVPLMNKLNIEAGFSSDLSRAYETGKIALSDYRVGVIQDPRFREANIGIAEGLTFDEIALKFSEDSILKWRSYEEYNLDFKYDNGESKRQIMIRIRDAVLDIIQNTDKNNIAIFAHGMVMRALTFAFNQGVDWNHVTFSNGSVHHFSWDEKRPDYLKYHGKIES